MKKKQKKFEKFFFQKINSKILKYKKLKMKILKTQKKEVKSPQKEINQQKKMKN